MWILLVGWLASALAVEPDDLEARLAEVEPMRAMRLAKDAPALSSSQVRRAADGVTATDLQKDGSPIGKAYGAAVVDVGIGLLWSAINDNARHTGWTGLSYAEVIAGRPCQTGRRVLQTASVPILGDRWWISVPAANTQLIRYSSGAVRELSFKSSVDAGEVTSASGQKILETATPIASSRGAWFLVAVDSRHTYVEYFVQTDPGAASPSGLVSSFAQKGVRQAISAMRSFAKEGNPSCPIE